MYALRQLRHRRTIQALLGGAVLALLLQLFGGGAFSRDARAGGDRFDFSSAICSTAVPAAGSEAPAGHADHLQCKLCCAGVALAVDSVSPGVVLPPPAPTRDVLPRTELRPRFPHWAPDGARAPPVLS